MISPYRVFVAVEVVTKLRTCRLRERQAILRLLDQLSEDPCLRGDYVETDDIGRPIQVLVLGSIALCFWVDHAVREVKVMDLKSAGH